MTLAFLALCALVPGALAPGALAPGPAAQSILEGEALRFAQAWVGEDLSLLGEIMAEDGIRLHLPGEDHVLIRPRQARAALGAFLDRYSGGEAELTRVSPGVGDPGKGFAEIRWQTGSPGVPEPVILTLFVAFSLVDDRWSVTEIRVLF
jgi:hypothetical protein